MLTITICVSLLLAPLQSAVRPAPSIEAVAWLAGHWVGTGTDDLSEEVWLPAAANSMVGVWRWASKGELRLYEMLTIAKEQDRLVLRLRHFRPNLDALEDKTAPFVLPATRIDAAEVVFEGKGTDGGPLRITYRRAAPDRLVALLDRAGKTTEFTYQRKQP